SIVAIIHASRYLSQLFRSVFTAASSVPRCISARLWHMRSRTSPSLQPTIPAPSPSPSPSAPPPPDEASALLNPIRPSIRGRLESSAKRLSLIITEDILSKITAMHHYRGGRARHAR